MPALPRVLLVGPTPPPEGGMARVVEDCRAALLAGGKFEPLVIEIKHGGTRRLGAFDMTNLRLNMQLYHLLRSELVKPNTALVHMHASVGSRGTVMKHILLARAVKASRAKLLLQPHSGAIEELLREGSPPWKSGMTRLLQFADRVVVTSPYWLRLMQQHWPEHDYALLPNGVDTDYYRPADEPAETVSGAGARVLFIGHLTAYKGLAELAEAWTAISAAGQPQPLLRIVGAARDEGGEALASQLSALPGVEMCGLVSSGRKLELLRSSDIFVLPSHYENLPISLLEAMACGLAPVASSVGAVPEILADDCGLTCPPRDANALAEALQSLVADPARRARLAANARRRALESYSMQRFSRGLHELYERSL